MNRGIRSIAIIAATVLASGCGSSKKDISADDGGAGSPSPAPTSSTPGDSVSGTRLKARTYVAEDGAKQFIGWHDSQLNLACGFRVAGDGALRCLPSVTAGSIGLFADAKCTVPLFAGTRGCPQTLAVKVDTGGANCGDAARSHVFKVTPFSAANIYSGSAAACTMSPASNYTSIYDLYSAPSSEVDPTTYVAATEQAL